MITAFLPCRLGSQRVPDKNTKDFAGVEGGLTSIKLKQLLDSKKIDVIVLSTNDTLVMEIAKRVSKEIIIDERPNELALSSTSTDELIEYIPKIIKEGHVLWTHTTSPFLTPEFYDSSIETYIDKVLKDDIHDSLMTVNKIHSFLWNKKGSFNYDRQKEKWPRTQTLEELFEINSGVFLNSIQNYRKFKDRIGMNPFLLYTKKVESFDIDWPEDFDLAEMIYEKLNLI